MINVLIYYYSKYGNILIYIFSKLFQKEQRFCTLCNSQYIEDEFHLLFVCPIYGYIRNGYYLPLSNVSYICGN